MQEPVPCCNRACAAPRFSSSQSAWQQPRRLQSRRGRRRPHIRRLRPTHRLRHARRRLLARPPRTSRRRGQHRNRHRRQRLGLRRRRGPHRNPIAQGRPGSWRVPPAGPRRQPAHGRHPRSARSSLPPKKKERVSLRHNDANPTVEPDRRLPNPPHANSRAGSRGRARRDLLRPRASPRAIPDKSSQARPRDGQTRIVGWARSASCATRPLPADQAASAMPPRWHVRPSKGNSSIPDGNGIGRGRS